MGNKRNKNSLDYSSGKVSFTQNYVALPAPDMSMAKKRKRADPEEAKVYESAAVFPLDKFLVSTFASPLKLAEFLEKKGHKILSAL